MANLLAVAGGGALGAAARYLVYVGTTGVLDFEAPVATLIVNVVGSFLMGLWIEAAALALAVSQQAQLFFVVGVLGGFTTFSAFALDFAVLLYERGRFALCLAYVGASVALSLAALFAGLYAAREYL